MTLYTPEHFACSDRQILFDLMRDNSFATLISIPAKSRDPDITHVPVMVDEASNRVLGHVARANPIWQSFTPDREVQLIFHGPHHYISPSWYAVHPSVPTWNYAVVHVRGVPRLLEDRNTIEAMLQQLVAENESRFADPWEMDLPDRYLQSMIDGIVAFEIAISGMQGKLKLSQNRSEADRINVIAALRESGGSEASSVARWMELLSDS